MNSENAFADRKSNSDDGCCVSSIITQQWSCQSVQCTLEYRNPVATRRVLGAPCGGLVTGTGVWSTCTDHGAIPPVIWASHSNQYSVICSAWICHGHSIR